MAASVLVIHCIEGEYTVVWFFFLVPLFASASPMGLEFFGKVSVNITCERMAEMVTLLLLFLYCFQFTSSHLLNQF
jgi:hypothetical protein